MKRFRFPLQPVKVLRAHDELRAREALGVAMAALAGAEAELAGARARVARFAAVLQAGRQERFSGAAEVHALAAYRRECGVELAAERAMHTARTAMQQRRMDYIEADRRLEIVHRLEAKARTSHRIEASREEQAEFDDRAGRQARLRAHPLS